MKKFIRIFLAIALIFCNTYNSYASFLSLYVARLSPASAVAGAAGSITIPALVRGVTSGGLHVSSWLPLFIPGGNVAKIAAAVACVGGALAADYLFLKAAAWYAAKGLDKNLIKASSVDVPDGKTQAYYFDLAIGKGGIFADAEEAYAKAVAHAAGGSVSSFGLEAGYGAPGYTAYKTDDVQKFFYTNQSTPHHVEPKSTQLTAAEFETMLSADLAADNANAKILGQAAIDAAAAALDNPYNPINYNNAIKAAIAAALAQSLTQAQKDALELQGVPPVTIPVPENSDYTKLTPAQIAAAVQQALAGQGLSDVQIAAAVASALAANQSGLTATQLAASLSNAGLSATQIGAAVAAATGVNLSAAQTKEAVKDAIDDETDVVAPIDPSFTMPEKKSLTTILTSFMNSIKNMPFLAALTGITIQCSGSSTLCLNLPAKFGGNVCYDASPISGALNNIGTAMLSCVTIVMFIYIFRSN